MKVGGDVPLVEQYLQLEMLQNVQNVEQYLMKITNSYLSMFASKRCN